MNIEIYYDGVSIKENSGKEISGFTTNISFMKQAKICDYEKFIKDSLKHSNGRPISFQLYDDVDEEIEATARKITSYHPSIFVKIPVMKTSGDFNSSTIKKLHDEGLKINVTAIFTKGQVDSLSDCFKKDTEAIISIFAGRINDCGESSAELVNHARETFIEYPNIKILWAACRTVYNMIEAESQGADIVTVPESVLKRMLRLEHNPTEASLDTVKQFRSDGLLGKIKFK